jgi:hypothetical protein
VVADADRNAAFALAATLARSGVADVRVLTDVPAGEAGAQGDRLQRFAAPGIQAPRP